RGLLAEGTSAWVSRIVAPKPPPSGGPGRILAARALPLAAGLKSSPGGVRHDERWLRDPRTRSCACLVARSDLADPRAPVCGRYRLRPQVGRDHPLSLSISISGGEETYEDSPSNGERTGKRPG